MAQLRLAVADIRRTCEALAGKLGAKHLNALVAATLDIETRIERLTPKNRDS
jgi:hypothetical protein